MAMFSDRTKLAIEFCERSIKVAEVSLADGPRIVFCSSEEASSDDPKDISVKLRQTLRARSVKSKEAVLVIPRQSVTVKNIMLPSGDRKEIAEMAAFQAMKQIPFPKEEIIYGFDVTGMTPEGYSKVMLVICHRDAVERPISILKECGLAPSSVTLSTYGLLNWLSLDTSIAASFGAAPAVFIDCDSRNSEIAVVHKGKLIYTRGLTFGVSEGIGYDTRLIDEASNTLSVFEKDCPGSRPSSAVLTGDLKAFPNLDKDFEKSLGIKARIRDEKNPSEAKGSFSALAGAASGPHGIDLLPESIRAIYSAKTRTRELLITALLIAALSAVLSLVVLNKIQQKKQMVSILEKRLADLAPEAQELERKRFLSDIVEAQEGYRTMPLKALNELQRVTPPAIDLTNYRYEEGRIEIKGTATSLSGIFNYVNALEDSPLFENVAVRSTVTRKSKDGEISEFDIACSLSGGKEKDR